MNKVHDVLRVMDELNTFTNADIEDALEMSQTGAARVTAEFAKRGLIYKVKIGHMYLWALTIKGERLTSNSNPIDLEERALLLSWPELEGEE